MARLRDWVSSHRKAQRAAKKGTAAVVKGAKEVWYRRDAAGYLWLSLRWQPAAVEQYPGAAPPNFTYAASHLQSMRNDTRLLEAATREGCATVLFTRALRRRKLPPGHIRDRAIPKLLPCPQPHP